MGCCFSSNFQAYADLDFAISQGHSPQAVAEYLQRVTDINAVLPISRMTAMELATYNGRGEIVQLLLGRGAAGEWVSSDLETTMQRAAEHGSENPARRSIEHTVARTARSPRGSTSMPVEANNEHLAVLSEHLEQDSGSIDSIEVDDQPLLHYGVLSNNPDLISTLIRRGMDINEQNEVRHVTMAACALDLEQDGETPVFVATKTSRGNCLRMLLEAGADPNISTRDGDFAIHEAVNQGSIESTMMLLEHGADRTKTGKDGLTPLQRAQALSPSSLSIFESLLNDYTELRIEEEAPLDRKLGDEEMKQLGHEVKECICCPITCEVMRDPVMAADGHTYERKAIQQWLRQKRESPVTRQPLPSSALTPNLTVRHLINQYMNISERQ